MDETLNNNDITPEFEDEIESGSTQEKKACPHLGIQFDPKSLYVYPSDMHRCYHTQPVGAPVKTHQARVCLTSSYEGCPVFNQPEGLKMPPELSGEQKMLWRSKKIILQFAGLVLALVVILTLSALFGKGSTPQEEQPVEQELTQVMNQSEQETATSLAYIIVLDEINSTPTSMPNLPTATATLALTPTAILTPEITLAPTSTHGLDMVIGDTYKFIIHRTMTGESVQMYADLYNTTPQAIYDSNYLMPVPIWINWLIIIPVDMTDTSDLPAFEAYMVEKDGVRLDVLADELSVKLYELMLYNDLELNHILNNGDWLLIPRERPDLTN